VPATPLDTLDRLPQGARVLAVRLRSLGDCVLTTPALRILKSARPDLRVGVVVEPRFRAVFEDNPDIADLLPPNAVDVFRHGASLAINLHGGTRSVVLTALSRAPRRAGFAHYRHGWPAHNIAIPRAQEILGLERKVHTAEHLASAMFHLGAPVQEIPRARLHAEPSPIAGAYAAIHAQASSIDKTWPAARFLEAARHIQACGLEPVFIGGPGDDLGAFSRFRRLAGQPLHETKRILSGAGLFLGNDSGPAHMAAAFGLPVVVLFGASDPVVWAPWRTVAEQIVAPDGLSNLPVGQVAAAIDRALARAA
jgi:ADP-heptose:LPS heptosyltransferase